MVDFVRRGSEATEIGARRFILWLDLASSKCYGWRTRYGKVNRLKRFTAAGLVVHFSPCGR